MKISRRIKASRANGAKSRGPKTPEGKLRSQTHAIRHGLLAKCVVVAGEDPGLFKKLMADCENRFAPVDDMELGMVEEMAAAYWRMRRGWTIEAELLNQGLRVHPSDRFAERLAATFTNEERMHKLALLQRYESRLHRMFQRAMNALITVQQYKTKQEITEQPDPICEQPDEPQAPSAEQLPEPASKSTEFCEQPFPAAKPPAIAPTRPDPLHQPGNQEENPAA